ncbi:MAG: hypothetical protein KF681_02245 [Bdellovibrionaceae bacterium]|nr:hypothetical protein [Pseudobdellovibrionaceae bacterium]
MNTMKMTFAIAGFLLLAATAQAQGRTVRATELSGSMWSDLTKGKLSDVVVEFRQGDELPVTFEAEGDLIETRRASVSYIGVKKNFWLRLSQRDVEISFDGVAFKKLGDALSGSLEAGAGSAQNGGVADAINLMFKAYLK